MLLFIFQWTVLKNTYKQKLEFGGESTQETDFLLHILKNSFWPIKKLCMQSQYALTHQGLWISGLCLNSNEDIHTWLLILRPSDSSTNTLVKKKIGSQWLD